MKKSYNIDSKNNDMRIDRWIRNNIGHMPQSLIEKFLRNGKIKLNKKKVKSSTKVKTNDLIDLFNLNYQPKIITANNKFDPSPSVIKANEKLIIDDNENFVVINKMAGTSVQGGTKSRKNIIDIFAKSEIFKDSKPYSVHRLDKETSGVFIIAKNRETAQLLTSLFRLRKIHKTYLGICHGEIDKNSGEWCENLVRYENGKKIIEKAKTVYKVIDKNINSSLVEMHPITGRKHQLRKQLFAIGNPIFGDKKYGYSLNYKSKNINLMLHSYKIKFMINNKKYTYTALVPDYFKKILKVKRLKFSNF